MSAYDIGGNHIHYEMYIFDILEPHGRLFCVTSNYWIMCLWNISYKCITKIQKWSLNWLKWCILSTMCDNSAISQTLFVDGNKAECAWQISLFTIFCDALIQVNHICKQTFDKFHYKRLEMNEGEQQIRYLIGRWYMLLISELVLENYFVNFS